MKQCLALRHVPFEDLGLFAEPLRRQGYNIKYNDTPIEPLQADEAADADLLVILGGPISAIQLEAQPWLAAEFKVVAARLSERRPTLGICLGAQLMAKALGAAVVRASAQEIGWAPIVLTGEGADSPLSAIEGLRVLHWHEDRFELPIDAVSLAATPLCPHQAFAVGRHALALQFHAEVVPGLFEAWLVGNASEFETNGIDPEELRRGMQRNGPVLVTASQTMISEWLRSLNRGR